MSKYCGNCGNIIDDNATFCDRCGNKQQDIVAQSQVFQQQLETAPPQDNASSLASLLSVKLAAFSAILAVLAFLFQKIDNVIGTLAFAIIMPVFIICVVASIYQLVIGKMNATIKLAHGGLFVALFGFFMGMHNLVVVGIGICFILIAVHAFKIIFMKK